MSDILVEKIRKEIEHFTPQKEVEEIGHVVSVGDGVALIDGLPNAVMGEMIVFEEGEGTALKESIEKRAAVYGLVLNLEEEVVKTIILGDTSHIKEGDIAKSSERVLSIPVSEELKGRVINPLGEVLDGKGDIASDTRYPIERQASGVIDRQSVNVPLHTGSKAIDSMVPIGRGQRELIIGDRFTGKTTLAIDAILNQKNEPEESRPHCIYVAIGQKESKTARIVALLKERGAMEYTTVISTPASAPAALQFLAPFSGAAVGEYSMDRGKDALVIYDDLSKHAVAYRALSLLLRRPPGREAYPGDIFYLHSRLLERSAKLSEKLGGGSLTALPIIETQEGDVSAYIPTNVISITDGQIYLDTDIFNKNIKPAINVGLSVSRVGSSAQTKAMKKVAGKIRLELAQFRELEAFMQFSQDLDEDTKKRIEKGVILTEFLKQDKNVPLPFEKQVAVIHAATSGAFDSAAPAVVREIETKLLDFLENQHGDILDAIRKEKELSLETEEKLQSAVASFKETHVSLFAEV